MFLLYVGTHGIDKKIDTVEGLELDPLLIRLNDGGEMNSYPSTAKVSQAEEPSEDFKEPKSDKFHLFHMQEKQ